MRIKVAFLPAVINGPCSQAPFFSFFLDRPLVDYFGSESLPEQCLAVCITGSGTTSPPATRP